MKAFLFTIGVGFTLLFGAWAVASTIKVIQFDRGCEGYLKRAADSNSVELAKENLSKALVYIENNHLTSGYTSIFYNTPDEDVGFWYQNLKASLDELNKLSPSAASLEKTNVLMKLRETLLDSGDKGTQVTLPSGIAVYPSNSAYMLWGLMTGVIAILCWVFIYFLDL